MTDERDFELPYPLRPYPKLIINAAITGMVPTKADNPNIPISVPEIIDDAIRCCRAGA
jgi:3-keto-5-aminohexanoate cleavage enzyme